MNEGGSGDGASLSLKRFRGGGLGQRELLHWDPGRYVKKVSGYGHLFPWGPNSSRVEPGIRRGGTYTGDFER